MVLQRRGLKAPPAPKVITPARKDTLVISRRKSGIVVSRRRQKATTGNQPPGLKPGGYNTSKELVTAVMKLHAHAENMARERGGKQLQNFRVFLGMNTDEIAARADFPVEEIVSIEESYDVTLTALTAYMRAAGPGTTFSMDLKGNVWHGVISAPGYQDWTLYL